MFDLFLQWLFFPLVMRYEFLLLRAFLCPLWALNMQCSIVDHLCGLNGSEGFIFLLLVFLFGLVEHLCIFDNAHLFCLVGMRERIFFSSIQSLPLANFIFAPTTTISIFDLSKGEKLTSKITYQLTPFQTFPLIHFIPFLYSPYIYYIYKGIKDRYFECCNTLTINQLQNANLTVIF